MVNGELEVLLEYAEGIKERSDLLGCLYCFNAWDARKPYISIQYGNKEIVSKIAQGADQGRKFIWNEKLRFNVEIDQGDEISEAFSKLTLQVMDKHNISDDDYVGEATTHVKDLVLLGMQNGKGELESRKYRVVRPDKSYSGDISFSVTFKVLNHVFDSQS